MGGGKSKPAPEKKAQYAPPPPPPAQGSDQQRPPERKKSPSAAQAADPSPRQGSTSQPPQETPHPVGEQTSPVDAVKPIGRRSQTEGKGQDARPSVVSESGSLAVPESQTPVQKASLGRQSVSKVDSMASGEVVRDNSELGNASPPHSGHHHQQQHQQHPPDRQKKRLLNGTNIDFRYPSGSRYHGGFKDGKLHGYGKYTYHPSGDVYEGEWWNDMKHGRGTYFYESGDRYIGEWRYGKKHGKGSYTFVSGDEYIGAWKGDRIHGYGIFVIVRNGNRYEGEWEDSYRHGYGVLLSGNGDRYEGQWVRGKEEGHGILTYLNGNCYCGEWKLGQMDGKGVLLERGVPFLVEHISGYMISSVAADPGDVDPEWTSVWQLAEHHIKKQQGVVAEKKAGAQQPQAVSGHSHEEVEMLRRERDMLAIRVDELLAARADAGLEGDQGGDEALRQKVLSLAQQAAADASALKACREALEAANQSLVAKDEELKAMHEQLEAMSSTLLSSPHSDDDPNCTESDRLRILEGQLRQSQQERVRAQQGGDAAAKRIAELEAEVQALKAQLLEKPVSNAPKEAAGEGSEQLHQQLSDLRAKLKHANETKEDILELQARLELAEAGSLDLDTIRKERDTAREELKTLEAQGGKWKEREQELLLDVRTQRDKVVQVQGQLKAVEQQHVADMDHATATGSEAVKEKDTRIAELEDKAKKAKKKTKEAEQKAHVAEEQVKVAAALEADLRKTIAKVEADLETRTAESAKKAEAVETQLKAEKDKARRLFNTIEDMKGKIRVFVRTRPFLHTEKARKDKQVVVFPDQMTVAIEDDKSLKERKEYLFDTTFPADASQERVFDECKHLIRSAVDGFNVCIFAYGQTGSGKTFTLGGSTDMPGVAPRSMEELFNVVENMPLTTYSISCYMVELYNDKLFDLFRFDTTTDPPRLDIKKDQKGTVTIPGTNIIPVANLEELQELYAKGQGNRHVRLTKMNDASSRSHLMFSILIETTNTETKQTACGKLSIVDLAGSERLAKTGVEDPIAVAEAQAINLSLTALGNVISALSAGQKHVPYRTNKLTLAMSDSLGGNAKTLMFVNISPANYNTEETVSSLNYASRVKLIKNNPAKTIETAEIKRLKGMISKLKKAQSAEEGDFQDIQEVNVHNGGNAPPAQQQDQQEPTSERRPTLQGDKAKGGNRRRSVSPRP